MDCYILRGNLQVAGSCVLPLLSGHFVRIAPDLRQAHSQQDIPTLIVGVYGPNDDEDKWWLELQEKIETKNYLHVILGGDINLVIDPEIDCKGYSHSWFPKKRKLFNDWLNGDVYIDAFRDLYPKKREYSWSPFVEDQKKKERSNQE